MSRTSTNTKTVFVIFLFLNLGAWAFYGFMLISVSKQSARVTAFANELAYEVEREGRLNQLGKLIEDVEEDRILIDERFISTEEQSVVEYIKLIESLSQYTPVSLEILSVNVEGGDADTPKVVIVSLLATGSKSAVKDLIDLVELLPISTTIDTAGINITSLESRIEKWNVSITLRALALK